jgi:hypothetical protein
VRLSFFRRLGAAVAGVVLVVGGSTLLASPALADQTWHQSVERGSATATCPISSEGDLAIGWSQWGPSWAQWANGGKGGYVCDRSITWAKATPPPSEAPVARCISYFAAEYFILAVPNSFIPFADLYSDSDCTTLTDSYTSNRVYATDIATATEICDANMPPGFNWVALHEQGDPDLYSCIRFG